MMLTNFGILKVRWENLLKILQIEPRKSEIVFNELVAAYARGERFYHTLKHIQQVLETIEEIQGQTAPRTAATLNFSAIELAAWFHDVVYEPQGKDNEEKSAVYASIILTSFNLPRKTIQLVQALILNTKHDQISNDLQAQILLDSDLAILGASKSDYQAYSKAIRREYSWLTEELYSQGRKQVLQKFLQRERIYLTEQMYVKLELPARLNLQAELSQYLALK